MIDKSPLHGPRFSIRLMDPSEIGERFAGFYNNPDNRFFNQTDREYDEGQLRDWCAQGLQDQNCFYYGAFFQDDEALAGTIRIGVIDLVNSTSDMVALVGETKQRGKGLGTELIRLGNRAAFERHNIRKLCGGMFEANQASVKAYVRAGWVIEGRLAGHYLTDGKPMDRILVACFNPSWQPPAA